MEAVLKLAVFTILASVFITTINSFFIKARRILMFFDYYNGSNFIKGFKVIKVYFYLFSSFSYFSISICALPRLLAVSPYLYGQTLSV